MLCAPLYVLAFAAAATAAPFFHDYDYDYSHRHSHEPYIPQHMPPHQHLGSHLHYGRHPSPAFGDDMFDARRFWLDLSREMMNIDHMIQDLHKRFPSIISTSNYIDGKYKVTIPLEGFKEEEITVKAKNTLLMVQAVHEGKIKKTYIDARDIPNDIDARGTWTYDGKLLVIVFPVKQITDDKSEETPDHSSSEVKHETKETDTSNRGESREEMDPDQKQDNADADVGITNQSTTDEEIETNVIPTSSPVDVTTYSVDIKDDVEFVPVKY